MSNKPLGSSTPNAYSRPSRRRGVHSYNDDDILSPVLGNKSSGSSKSPSSSPHLQKRSFETTSDFDDTEGTESGSESEGVEAASCDVVERERSVQGVDEWSWGKIFVMVIVVVCCLLGMIYSKSESVTDEVLPKIEIEDLKNEYPMLEDDFWLALQTGVQEVLKFGKPSVFVLLYKENDREMTERILTNVSSYTSCWLNNNCNKKPLILCSEELNHNDMLKQDSGYFITTYKRVLEDVHVMIIKNLEDLPGYAAKALHSFCDAYSPLVEKAVFFFTLKVPEFPEKEIKYVESVLRNKWHDIKEDHFDPLFTRISSIVLSLKL